MRNAGLEEAQAGIKIAGRNINNLRYADDTTLTPETPPSSPAEGLLFLHEVTQPCLTLATPWTAAYQAPPSMGFSRQKYWSGVPLPSPLQALTLFIAWPIPYAS